MNWNEWTLIQIHHQFPPLKSPGVQRNAFLASHLFKHFKKACVITQNPVESEFEQEFNFDDIDIIRIDFTDFRQRVVGKRNDATVIDDRYKKGKVRQWLLKLRNSYPFNIWFGDGGRSYIRKVYHETSKIIENNPKTLVYTSFPPYTDHYIGYKLKKAYPEILWVADFRDLHIEPIYKTTVFPKLQIKWNRSMLAKADLITTISNGLEHQLKKYRRPTHTMYNGLRANINPGAVPFNKFTISYTGSLYKDFRDPSYFFNTLRELMDDGQINPAHFQFIYAGRHGERFQAWIDRYKLNDIFENRGIVSRKESIEIQQKAHINLLLTSASKDHFGILTGKFYEYLASLNPILVLINGPDDPEFRRIILDLDAGYIFHSGQNTEELKAYIMEVNHHWRTTGTQIRNMNAKKLQHYFSWDKEVEILLDCMSRDA